MTPREQQSSEQFFAASIISASCKGADGFHAAGAGSWLNLRVAPLKEAKGATEHDVGKVLVPDELWE
ncbi:hypothetical protein WME90_46700 [Sorangium sp. So ce375]|uniref:hypothetical protein n=1 Tax=Sorangium sp. So ce375 TaxID=3133306 RepID=UPI003F5B29BD